MTTQNADTQPSVEGPAGGDYLLEHLVHLVDETGLEIGITLFVGGILVSGLLVDGQKYLDGNARRFLEANGPDEAKRTLIDFMQKTDRGQPPGTDGGDEVTSQTGYVHLRAARVMESGSGSNEGIWWRGRIDRVDAFHFGVLREPTASKAAPNHPANV